MADDRGTVVLSANDLCLTYGTITIFDNASLTIHENDRVGIVGKNGAGKSTLLKIIADVESPASGDISKKKKTSHKLSSSEFELDENATVQENILNGAADILDMITEYESLDPASGKPHNLSNRFHILMVGIWNRKPRFSCTQSVLREPSKKLVTLEEKTVAM